MQMKEYFLLMTMAANIDGPAGFSKQVSLYTSSGWEPHGRPQIITDNDCRIIYYVQALVKDSK